MELQVPYDPRVLPVGVRSRFVDNNNGCTMHVLEAGHELAGRPCVLLLHGFPELAYSWRKQLPFLAALGYHVVAPDLRGYGRSGGADVRYDDDLLPYTFVNRVADALGLVKALGHERVAAVIGHDYGSPVAAWCALLRPDVFRSLVMMSAAFPGPPVLPTGTAGAPAQGALPLSGIPESLAALPRPRKHYRWYYATREANQDMWHCSQGVRDFLRAYFHYKSGDWPGNEPFTLGSWAAGELAKMPTYYVMDRDRDMAQTVAPEMPTPAQVAACRWLTEPELDVYAAEYGRTGFQGGLQGYRIGTDARFAGELKAFAGRTIDVPALFVSGARDWGAHQAPGALERMTREVCTRMAGTHFVEGAGHWVQQERGDAVNLLLSQFLAEVAG
ncbi:alpha/beta fold hydrolase [Ramlibacter sp. AN1133]|uniref:alpha/beta fold hydrolase n=1 Tax=Ramlibacter sp. AN1133 TaxID=3133429 RepID=UPI0030BE7808